MEVGEGELQIAGAAEAIRPGFGDFLGELSMEVVEHMAVEQETDMAYDAPGTMAVMDVQAALGVEQGSGVEIDRGGGCRSWGGGGSGRWWLITGLGFRLVFPRSSQLFQPQFLGSIEGGHVLPDVRLIRQIRSSQVLEA